ncbi:MAG: ATP synthase F1 subunit gamma [Lachnospiraceae bacterium]|nr:ATP synthase F1 subunit gamma [Lachnospiraceae bacterium]
MANSIEIKNRIKSIRDTMKITRAMYMISSNKLQKARQSQAATEPYFHGLRDELEKLMEHFPEIEHIYFDNRPKDKQETIKRQGFVVITGDKGLAGAYNHNVLKKAEELYRASDDPHLFVIGQVGYHYFSARDIAMDKEFHYTAQNPTLHRARLIKEVIVDAYLEEQLDEVYVIYTGMVNSLESEVKVDQILPLKRRDFLEDPDGNAHPSEYEFLPSPGLLLEQLVPGYVTGFIFGALTEAFCCEQNARMMAMKSATDNASEMLRKLSIEFNRARQAAITQEITEVVGGAKALKRRKG